ncbi:uncharacterized protein SCHCODRAFT_02022394 [Schizophyllum commune H4-8]|uniref:uncharacterized protein n=1 Tax=Schizophyllum commune (strain H4-8 / FGSC 9210) TaxID=578458 RepID=UPI002160F8BA|nr:uncharacterized protein SCHCODRAFT_02022394 [Schizophyllum commune H4-8]KAI5899858.1 hypothetical protein SCHCODRAFT_02022394 [Schizophyllum commune H4-8]
MPRELAVAHDHRPGEREHRRLSVFLPAFLQARNMYFCQATHNAPVLLIAARREGVPHDRRVPSRSTDVLIAAIGPSTLQVPPTTPTRLRLATFAGARPPPCSTRLSRTATPEQQSGSNLCNPDPQPLSGARLLSSPLRVDQQWKPADKKNKKDYSLGHVPRHGNCGVDGIVIAIPRGRPLQGAGAATSLKLEDTW